MHNVIALILGGGKGTRLHPLTEARSKPAVPIGGKYRIIDIPVSNCINSDIRKMFVVTQFNSKSLNHHINHAYRFDIFSKRFVDILAAEQTYDNINWYQGTADAVRHNMRYIQDYDDCDTVLILSGDQLYRMDYRELYKFHIEQDADMTLATLPVPVEQVPSFGIMKITRDDEKYRVSDFAEKPKDFGIIQKYATSETVLKSLGFEDMTRTHLASMGIYMFKRKVLERVLTESSDPDFGHHIIPQLISSGGVAPYIFDGYWEDIGTIKSFHQANLDLVGENPTFKVYEPEAPFYTNPRFLPPAFIDGADMDATLVAEGARILGGHLRNSVVGLRSMIRTNTVLHNVVMLGADYYEDDLTENYDIPMGIGEGTVIKNAIIDKNARIGAGVKLENRKEYSHYDPHDDFQFYVRDGVIVVPKNAVIPDGVSF